MVPDKLFRFRPFSLDSKAIARAEEVILNNKMYFTSPKHFNDPFECRVNIDTSKVTGATLRAYFEGSLRKGKPHIPPIAIRRAMKDEQTHVLRKYLIDTLEREFSAHGICCFNEEPFHPLMWSHYANGHRGYCLVMGTGTWIPNEVRYPPTYPAVTALNDETWRDQFEPLLYTKADFWEYEKEWRVFSNKPGHEYFESSQLLAIILGAEMQAAAKQKLRSLVAIRSKPIPIYEAKLGIKNYTVDIPTFKQFIESRRA